MWLFSYVSFDMRCVLLLVALLLAVCSVLRVCYLSCIVCCRLLCVVVGWLLLHVDVLWCVVCALLLFGARCWQSLVGVYCCRLLFVVCCALCVVVCCFSFLAVCCIYCMFV